MNTMTNTRKALFGGLALGLACIFALSTGNASAYEHGGRSHNGISIGVGIGTGGGYYGGGYNRGGYGGGYYRGGYTPYYGSYTPYYSGYSYYNTAPRVWVDGYYETVNTPVLVYGNRYETRYTQVWHPGCYR